MHQTNNISSIQLFSEFFHENQEKFLSFAYSYIRDRQEAEDILMESMITLWENRDKWEEDSNLHGLLLTIIKNKALNYLAHLQVRLRAEEEINSHSQRELDLRISTLEACEPDAIFDSEIQHIVQKALKRMPNQSRQIFILSRYHDMKYEEMSHILGTSVGALKASYHHAVRKIEEYLTSDD